MWTYIKDRPKLLLSLLLGVWVLLNIISSLGSEISGGEAYLWHVAKGLDWSYMDSSPLGVLVAWLGFNVGSETLLGLRLFFILSQGFALYLFYGLVQTDGGGARSVFLYFLISLSIPLLHINGFFALADQLLMMVMVVGFWAYSKFSTSSKWWWALVLGGSFALVASVGYQGLLIVPAIVVCNVRLLRSFRFYLALAICVVLLAPQIWWQYLYDWPILAIHVALYDGYSLGEALSGLALTALRFNPFIVVVFLVIIFGSKKEGKEEPMMRLMKAMFWLSVALVAYTSSRSVTPALSMMPLLFPLLFVLVRSAESGATYRRYLFLSTSFSITMIVGIRLFVVVDTYGAAADEMRAHRLTDTLSQIGVSTVLFNDLPLSASMVDFHDSLPAYSMVSSRGKADQYALADFTSHLYEKKVAIQLPDYAVKAISWDSLSRHFVCLGLPDLGVKGYFQIVDRYIPTGGFVISPAVLPPKVLTDSRIAVTLTLTNPYAYEIALGEGGGKYRIIMQLKREPAGPFSDIILPIKAQVLAPGSQVVVGTTALIPNVETGFYSIVFTIREFPLPSPANSDCYTIQIINPKSRI